MRHCAGTKHSEESAGVVPLRTAIKEWFDRWRLRGRNATVAGQPLASGPPVTFGQLSDLEPRLGDLLGEARATQDDHRQSYFCNGEVWYGLAGYPGFKPRLALLVGWYRPDGHPVLSSSGAYETASVTIFGALPACRGPCPCL